MNRDEFVEWMDGNNLKAGDIAQFFGREERTISNWRSKGKGGIKPHIQDWVGMMVQLYERYEKDPDPQPFCVSIPATLDQFMSWDRRSKESGKTIIDWIHAKLDADQTALSIAQPHSIPSDQQHSVAQRAAEKEERGSEIAAAMKDADPDKANREKRLSELEQRVRELEKALKSSESDETGSQ